MSNKLIAIRRTASFFALVFIAATLATLASYALKTLDPSTLIILGLSLTLVLCVYTVYNVFLSQLEVADKIKKITDKPITLKKETLL